MASHLWDMPLEQVPFAIVDVETTGLRPGWDRVVEIAVIHASATAPWTVSFESLLKSERGAGPTDVHGITEEMLERAPTFEDVAGPILDALRGRIVVAHNAMFDVRFLRAELARVAVDFATPFICSMELLAALNVAPRLSLDELRGRFRLPGCIVHSALVDAQTVGVLLPNALAAAHQIGFRKLGDFRRLQAGFVASLAVAPMTSVRTTRGTALRRPPPPTTQAVFESYFHALRDAVSDLVLDDGEVERLRAILARNRLDPARVRAAHASAFSWALHVAADDAVVTDAEASRLSRLHSALHALGWAPGDPVDDGSEP